MPLTHRVLSVLCGIFALACSGDPTGSGAEIIVSGVVQPRQGEVTVYRTVDASNPDSVVWSVVPAAAGMIERGEFVGYSPGPATIVASLDGRADSLAIEIVPRGVGGTLALIGRGRVSDRFTSDLWVRGSAAYTGTIGNRDGVTGNALYVWDVSDPAAPVLADSIISAAPRTNDVKISADGSYAVITHEGGTQNGITFLDLGDPLHPAIVSRHTEGLEGGVHNVWIDQNFLYAASDRLGDMKIISVTNLLAPSNVASFFGGSGFVHDVYARNGFAVVSHWDAGVIIVDILNGAVQGSPTQPRELSRLQLPGVLVHNAWYWVDAGYVFLGDEINEPGTVHVVDVSNLFEPHRIAEFQVAGATPHNFWVDEVNGVLYVGWYGAGLRAIDVSGKLKGRLDLQGREIAGAVYGMGSGCFRTVETCAWAPQLENGLIYVSDINAGLLVFELR